MAAFDLLPQFYDNVGQFLSKTDLNLIRTNVGLIDRWTYRAEPFFDSSTGLDTNTPGYVASDDPLRIWWGAVRYVAGCTTLTVEIKGAQSSAEVIKVYWNGTDTSGSGTLAMTLTPPASFGAFSGTYTLPGGLVDGQVYRIEVRAEGGHTTTADWEIQDIYLSTVSKSGWVAAPTFTNSTVNAANLNALCYSTQWVYDRMRLIPMVPHLSMLYNVGPFFDPSRGDPQHTNRPMYFGSVGRYYSNAQLRIAGVVQSITTPGWNFTLALNGTVVYTSPTYGIGNQYINLTWPLTAYTLGSRISVAIRASSTNGGSGTLRRTRWTFGIMRAEVDSSGWPYAALPSKFVGPSTGTTTWSTVVANLNNLSTIVNNAKARIDARPEQWARIRAMRRHYTRNTATESDLVARARPQFPQRVGSELFVAGQNVEIDYGLFTPGQLNANDVGWENYTFGQKQTVDDSANGKLVYLDDLKGLDVGSTYMLFGDPYWAGEYIG